MHEGTTSVQFSLDGHWRTAWPLTFLTDPVVRRRTGATEPELEAVLGYLKTQDALRSKSHGGLERELSDEEHLEDGKAPKDRRNGGKDKDGKDKDTKGKGKGKKDE